jgi:hypothetical protein
MSNESTTVDGVTEPSENITFEELIAQRVAKHSPTEEPETEEPNEEEQEPEEQSEETGETEEGDPEETDDEEEESEAEIDILSLTTEQIQYLAKKGKSRLLQRFGELTAQKHALEEKLTARPDTKPLPAIPAEDNPFRSLKTVEEIQAKYAELEKVAEETDSILEDHEDYAAEDIITLGNKEFTKKEIRLANRNARNAMLKFLPAQAAEIHRVTQRAEMEINFNAAIPIEIPEMADEKSELSQKFRSMMADPLVEQVRKQVPDLAPQLGYLLAHAVRSMTGQTSAKPRATATGIPLKAKVPSVPFGAGAARTSGKSVRKQESDAYQQFEKTGSTEDWIAARIARNSK